MNEETLNRLNDLLTKALEALEELKKGEATEARAFEASKKFIETNNIEVQRLTCSGDSDNDGYGTCAIKTADGDKIHLKCPVDFIDTKIFGASSCKEVFSNLVLE